MSDATSTAAPPQSSGTVPAVIDHVAHALERWELGWPRYVGSLGAGWRSGGANLGFAPSQLAFANGARIELLAPYEAERNPFLRRFLDRHGPGPHHLTFKVPDLDDALDAIAAHGMQAVNVDRSDPGWQEAFIHPRQAGGIVVQVAQSTQAWESPPPEAFPTPADPAAALVRATHAVSDLAAAVDLFVGLLGGRPSPPLADGTEDRAASDLEVVDVSWDAPIVVRLVGPRHQASPPPPLAAWLGGAPGRLHHVAIACADPGAVPGAVPLDGTEIGVVPGDAAAAVVRPEDNFGLRLVLCQAP